MGLSVLIECFKKRNKDKYKAEELRKKWIDTHFIGKKLKELEIWDQRDLSCFIEEVMNYLYRLTDSQLKKTFPEFYGAPEAILVGAMNIYFVLKRGENN